VRESCRPAVTHAASAPLRHQPDHAAEVPDFWSATLRPFILAFALVSAVPLRAAQDQATEAQAAPSRFFDPDDGWFDVSGFLDTAYGFIPVLVPITEPAVGYGAAGALVFVDRKPADEAGRYQRPNIMAVGGLGTEKGTRGAFAGHLGTWMDGKLRTLAGVADADVNLEFFGLGGNRNPGGEGVPYTVSARGGVVGASYRLGESAFWLGLNYALAKTNVAFDGPFSNLPGVSPADFGLRLAALTPSLTLDLRDNFFTPTRGWYVDLSVPLFREAVGSDRNFQTATLNAMHYRPLSERLFLSLRGTAKTSSDGTPFYLRPFVALRGVEALRYQGDQAAEAEAELRWQLHPRFSLVGFLGAGVAQGSEAPGNRDKTVTSGGAGVRYLIARTYGLHMSADVGVGPNGPILYVIFGSAWTRP